MITVKILFADISSALPALTAAEFYGLKVNRNNMACYPFHNDRSPSMRLDSRFYCYACGATGDSIDLTAKLFGLSLRDAAIKLTEDFGLTGREPRGCYQREEEKDPADVWIHAAVWSLIRYSWLLREWETEYAPNEEDADWHPLFCEAIGNKDRIDFLLDELMCCTAVQYEELMNVYGKDVNEINERLEQLNGRDAEGDRTCEGHAAMDEWEGPAVEGELCDCDGERSASEGSLLQE